MYIIKYEIVTIKVIEIINTLINLFVYILYIFGHINRSINNKLIVYKINKLKYYTFG
jgi:hypothetical protein